MIVNATTVRNDKPRMLIHASLRSKAGRAIPAGDFLRTDGEAIERLTPARR